MALDSESFNKDLYDLLKTRGYDPVPLNSQNQRVKVSQEADVFQIDFKKDGKDYGKVWITVDDAQNVIVYFNDEQKNSPSTVTPGADYDDTWTGFCKTLKQWAQRRQLGFELLNSNHIGDDMRQRDYYRMKEKLGESYHAMGKKASYNDAVPNVKIILQHNRALEEGEQRYRNIARIFLENEQGERFLAPTSKPGIARIYARHIAEGGLPNDERWNHIKSLTEEYSKMAGFVRATRGKEFNESAASLVNEGMSHYNNLRETLSRLTGHRGYQKYFESYTPALMEDDNSEEVSEMFMSSSLDPRIETALPIINRLRKSVTEITEVSALESWANQIIDENIVENMSMESSDIDESASISTDELEKLLKINKDPAIEKALRDKLASASPRNKEIEESLPVSEDDHTEEENDMATDNLNKMAKSSHKIGNKVKNMSGKDSLEPWQQQLVATAADKVDAVYHSMDDEVEEGLDANQKRAGQLGPTEKVKNNNIGKLVGASESVDPMLARIKRLSGI
jgi:ribosomal protein L15E